MRTVFCSSWPIATARLKAMVVLPTPPLGANTEMTASCRPRSTRRTACGRRMLGHELEARERHREDAVDALRGIDLDRVLRNGQDDDRDAQPGLVDLLDELGALDPALQQRVDDHDVGPQAGGSGRRPAAVDRTSSSLTACCVLRRPRMYCATWGTSSTIRRRVWSLLEPTGHRARRYHASVGPTGGHAAAAGQGAPR